MSGEKAKVKLPDGTVTEATEVAVIHTEAAPIVFTMADGYKVKLQVVLVKALRIDGATDELGNPVYLLQSHNIASTEKA